MAMRPRHDGGPAATLTAAHPPATTGTDAGSALIDLHIAAERAFARYDAAEGSHRGRFRAVRAIADALAVHHAVEQELVYPALRERTARHDGMIDREVEQGHLLDLLLVELGRMLPSEPRYDAKVGMLVELFRQHVRDQETTLLPELRRRLDDGERERLGAEMAERASRLRAGPQR
jgi:Hemerythrin HHE cation binding domain